MNDIVKNFIGEKVCQLFVIMWPPLGEGEISNTDISVGLIFADRSDKLYSISIDKEDNWTPIISEVNLPSKVYAGSELNRRIEQWMNFEIDEELEYEFYEFTHEKQFKSIVNNEIEAIQTLKVNGSGPFGIKFIFQDDYIQVTPISDGTTIETSLFNQNNNIEHFQKLGTVQFGSVFNENKS